MVEDAVSAKGYTVTLGEIRRQITRGEILIQPVDVRSGSRRRRNNPKLGRGDIHDNIAATEASIEEDYRSIDIRTYCLVHVQKS